MDTSEDGKDAFVKIKFTFMVNGQSRQYKRVVGDRAQALNYPHLAEATQ